MKAVKRFWGLHFDFHAKEYDEMGARIVPEDIESYILAAKPDFIQCDSKGHDGNSSYPTKVGHAAPLIKNDILRVWRDVTKKHNIPLYTHYSGVFDSAYTKANPEDAQYDKDGNPTPKISLFGDYLDKCMIPQLKEFVDEYGIDGAWIDGDCWAVRCDFSEKAKAVIGENLSPVEHNIAMRDAFFAYVKKYVDAIHAHAPDFKITSNWLYTPTSPDRPDIDIDFISGDLSDQDSVHDVRYAARCSSLRSKPWDLMAWGFEWGHMADKPAIQLMQEASTVLANGGGFQVYIPQNKDGSAKRADTARIAKLAEFVRAREMLYGKEPVAQVAILYSEYGYYHCREKDGAPFSNGGTRTPMMGVINGVLDAQYTLNVLCDYQSDRFGEYGIIAVSEWDEIGDEMKEKLRAYAEQGGNLVFIGPKVCRSFGKYIGTEFGENKKFNLAYVLGKDGCFAALNAHLSGEMATVLDLVSGEERIFSNADLRDDVLPAYRIDSLGKGKVAYIPFDFGELYFKARCYTTRNYLKDILNKLSAPIVEINRTNIDLTLQKNDDGIILNLLNMNQGRHSLYVLIYDEIPEIHDITVKVKGNFKSVNMPLGEKFTYEITSDGAVVHLDRLDIHSIIELK